MGAGGDGNGGDGGMGYGYSQGAGGSGGNGGPGVLVGSCQNGGNGNGGSGGSGGGGNLNSHGYVIDGSISGGIGGAGSGGGSGGSGDAFHNCLADFNVSGGLFGGGGGGGYGGGGGAAWLGGGGGGGSTGGAVTVASNGGAPGAKGGDGSIVITWTVPHCSLSAEPVRFNYTEFGTLVASMGLTSKVNDLGLITVQSGSTIYAANPDHLVTKVTPGAPSLKQGSDGLYRFTDSAGDEQVLRPAFLEPDALRVALIESMPGFVSFVIQTDGTGLLTTTANGATRSSVVTPALTLGTVPAEHWADSLWGGGSNWTYRVHAFRNATQGLTVKP